LNGSIDDLPIQDVLQVLSLGRKTGCLFLNTPMGAGAIVLRDGQIVASIDDTHPLPASEVASPSGAEREALIREGIIAFVHRLVRCGQGEFSFEATKDSPRVIRERGANGDAGGNGMDVIELLIEVASRPGQGKPGETHVRPEEEPMVHLARDKELVRNP
jgi:hypothetical protein